MINLLFKKYKKKKFLIFFDSSAGAMRSHRLQLYGFHKSRFIK